MINIKYRNPKTTKPLVTCSVSILSYNASLVIIVILRFYGNRAPTDIIVHDISMTTERRSARRGAMHVP